MILRQVDLKRFGKFDERSFEFRRGLNIVIGPNEAGKSTLMEAVPAALFGVRDKDRYKKWGRSADCQVSMAFESGGRFVKIDRNILTDRVRLIETDDLYQILYEFEGKVSPMGRSSERLEYFSRLAEFIPIVENDLFRASVFFGQGRLELDSKSGIGDRIKALLSGYLDVDYDRVLSSLQEDYFSISRENPWGKDKNLDRELEQTKSRLTEVSQDREALHKVMTDLVVIQHKIREMQESIDTDKAECARGQKYLAYVRRQWYLDEQQHRLQEEYERLSQQHNKVIALTRKKDSLRQELQSLGVSPELAETFPLLFKEGEETRQRLIQLQEDGNALRQELLSCAPPLQRWPILFTGVVLLFGGVAGWLAGSHWPYALLISILLVSMSWAVYVWRSGTLKAYTEGLKGQLRIVEQGREKAQNRLDEIDHVLEAAGLSALKIKKSPVEENFKRYNLLKREMGQLEAALQVLESLEGLQKDKDRLSRELAVVAQRLEEERPLRGKNLIPLEELPHAEEKLNALEISIKEREEKIKELLREDKAWSSLLEELPGIEAEEARLKNRLVFLMHRKKVLATAIELLSSSVEEFRRTYLDRFLSDISRYLGLISLEHYQEVACNENFEFMLKVQSQGFKPLDSFSQGTRDAVFLAIRLALSRHLAKGKKLPLLLDDPLVNLDRNRLTDTIKALETLSAEHQIIFFTHDESLLKRATRDRWNCVSLNEAKACNIAKSAERSENVNQLCLL
ncbi:AAA family ATPase [Desulfuromonas sp. AOP6]|uniref:ATP-binding protein n=1 Tax=Desulfuromonas sp. AOP6 TaxID=1566351 RepID=UPI0012804B6A|nr:AAA family ATPase [Desulfuromonas sp. AOP6]BCA79830.1 nuclease SbcCD subunit C [Desulfuromonas sp. AOP6]